jgi:hypothetical protein
MTRLLTITAITTLLVAAACSEGSIEDQASDAAGAAVEAGIRNAAAIAGAEAFENEGIELRDGLDCQATADLDAETVQVTCTGETTDGGAASVEGNASSDDASGSTVQGSFVGKVDDEVVFEEECLGTGC